jgi:UDP-perosamine 4-acetyltransferase
MKNVVIIGAGGHSKVVIDILRSVDEFNVIGCTAYHIDLKSILDVPIVGDDSKLPELFSSGVKNAFIAIGDNMLREKLTLMAKKIGFNLINAISPFAYISKSSSIGNGVAIMPGAVINAEVIIGNNVIINTSASIDHECVIEEYSHIAPGCHLAGNINIGRGSFLGIGSSVIPHVRIGQGCVIGAGTVVIKDLPPFSKSIGVPARVIGQI